MLFSFRWDGYRKPIGSMMFGISPELEIALYTICFRARPGRDCNVTLGGDNFRIRTVVLGKQFRGAYFRLSDLQPLIV